MNVDAKLRCTYYHQSTTAEYNLVIFVRGLAEENKTMWI